MGSHKVNVNVRIPVGLKKWLDELVEEGYYGNVADIIRLSLYHFREKIEKEKKEKILSAEQIVDILENSPNIKKKVLEALHKK